MGLMNLLFYYNFKSIYFLLVPLSVFVIKIQIVFISSASKFL